jgi:hypothetical protein
MLKVFLFDCTNKFWHLCASMLELNGVDSVLWMSVSLKINMQ